MVDVSEILNFPARERWRLLVVVGHNAQSAGSRAERDVVVPDLVKCKAVKLYISHPAAAKEVQLASARSVRPRRGGRARVEISE